MPENPGYGQMEFSRVSSFPQFRVSLKAHSHAMNPFAASPGLSVVSSVFPVGFRLGRGPKLQVQVLGLGVKTKRPGCR